MSGPDRRPFAGPPPPGGGAELAMRVARHRRHRTRALAAGGALASAAAVVALAVVGGSTQSLSNDRLDQATTPAPAQDVSARPSPSPAGPASPEVAPTTAVATRPPGPSAVPVGSAPPAPIPADARDDRDGAADATYRTPPMSRTTSTDRAEPAGTQFCSTYQADDSTRLGSRVNWCVQLRVEPAGGAQRLALDVCRDDTGPGELTYRDAFETDFAILDRDEREVWRWSAGRSGDGPGQALDVAAGSCVTWSVDWTGVDRRGQRLPAGQYTAVSTTFAQELAEVPNDRRTFTLR